MADEQIKYEDLPPEHKKKYNELKAIFEADLIGSFEKTRSHGIRFKWFQPEGVFEGIDMSLPSEDRTRALHQEINYVVAHSLHRHSESLVNTLERVALRVVQEIMKHQYSPSGPANMFLVGKHFWSVDRFQQPAVRLAHAVGPRQDQPRRQRPRGAHTLGIAHCASLQERLFPQNDVTLNKWFASQLRLTCPALNTDNTTNNDIRTPNVFDNKYYLDLLNRQGLFTSDQDLHTDARTKPAVTRFALDQPAFFDQFVFSVVKMGQINVLTGNQGQIRNDCSAPNKGRTNHDLPWSVLETVAEAAQTLVL
ncbi:hypothetical protein QYE76_058601 [Lolium multiflorum]|uniref:Peroxidase n=1 Tax=Lolium multiflorum TaxID=4521 RepID=A0AAD8T5X3_LOLMU|nr:hypothetical protein QYE76_058601 [Lolium multiflorum]